MQNVNKLYHMEQFCVSSVELKLGFTCMQSVKMYFCVLNRASYALKVTIFIPPTSLQVLTSFALLHLEKLPLRPNCWICVLSAG